jgi:hypothetical protein
MSRTKPARSHRFAAADAPVIVVDGFLPDHLAVAMRRDIEAHFANPHTHRPETHQVWNYWHVPDLYTYLRTSPERVIGPDHALGLSQCAARVVDGPFGLGRGNLAVSEPLRRWLPPRLAPRTVASASYIR